MTPVKTLIEDIMTVSNMDRKQIADSIGVKVGTLYNYGTYADNCSAKTRKKLEALYAKAVKKKSTSTPTPSRNYVADRILKTFDVLSEHKLSDNDLYLMYRVVDLVTDQCKESFHA